MKCVALCCKRLTRSCATHFRNLREEKKTFYASGAPPLAVISAGISIDAWETALEAFMPQTVKSMSDILKQCEAWLAWMARA